MSEPPRWPSCPPGLGENRLPTFIARFCPGEPCTRRSSDLTSWRGKNGFPGRGIYLSVVDRERCREDSYEAYENVLPDADDRRLTWLWPRSIPIDPATDIAGDRFEWLEREVGALTLPATIIWGCEDEVFRADVFSAKWHSMWPHAEGTHLVTGKHVVLEESGADIGELLGVFARRHAPITA